MPGSEGQRQRGTGCQWPGQRGGGLLCPDLVERQGQGCGLGVAMRPCSAQMSSPRTPKKGPLSPVGSDQQCPLAQGGGLLRI